MLSFTEAMRAGTGAAWRARDRGLSRARCRRNFRRAPDFAPDLIPPSSMSCRPRMSREQAYRGLMANKRAVLPGLGIKMVPFLLRLFPRSFILAAVGRLQLRQR